MTGRSLHKYAGLALLCPFLGWIVTAMIFYVKPGYEEAYAFLQVRTYPLDPSFSVRADTSWREFKCVRTILGTHLMVRTNIGWTQIDSLSHTERTAPTKEEVRILVADAIGANVARYGEIASISGDSIRTTTGVLIVLNWSRLSLDQRGTDTDRIDALYRIHYLQWTGIPAVDKVLGPAGLAMVALLSILGVRLALSSRNGKKTSAA